MEQDEGFQIAIVEDGRGNTGVRIDLVTPHGANFIILSQEELSRIMDDFYEIAAILHATSILKIYLMGQLEYTQERANQECRMLMGMATEAHARKMQEGQESNG